MANTPFQVKALYEYSSSHDDDLGFPNGQVITVTEEEDADWFYGEYNDMVGVKHQGLFPRNFVKPFEPETPPRPSRLSRSKKDVEPSAAPNDADEVARSEHLGPLQPQPVSEAPSSKEISSNGEPSVNVSAHVVQTARASDVPPPAPPTNLATKPPPSNMAKSAPPPVTEKAATSSFRDRINAFNKPAAAPVAPAKPSALGTSGGSGFIKKPFVAPPPSKNAYVALPREPPPQRFYRREEDPELTSQTSNALEGSEMAMPSRASIPEEDDVDVPKPTSLKDRIALLQKQQMEQAARHAEAGQKKEKPKRPPKKRTGSQELVLDHEYHAEPDGLGRIETGDSVGKQSLETPRDDSLPGVRSSTRSHKSRDATPVASPTTLPPRDFLSDGNDADQSGAGDTEDGDEFSTGRDDSDEKSRNQVPTMPHRTHQIPMSQADIGNKDDNVEEYDQDEEEVDPEVQRRMEIRERMAKMSGGMGLAGMFAPVGNVPMASKKQSSMSSDRKTSMASVSAASDTSAPRAPPVQILPMPGVQRVQTPEQEERPIEVSKVEEDNSHHTISSRDPEEIPDVEDLAQKSFPPSRKSTERTVPPPVPEGSF